MDGNGRWAKARGLNRTKGHEKGANVVREITTYCSNYTDIKTLTLYAFSTENWKRPKYEVDFLMKLLDRWLKQEEKTYIKNQVKFETIGDISKFSLPLQKTIQNIKEKTSSFDSFTQILALNYGSKDEIIRAIKKTTTINEENLNKNLDLSVQIDLLIRTGGEKRLSNFLLWQAAYAELFFIDKFWPDFTIDDLKEIIKQYHTRERRFGGL